MLLQHELIYDFDHNVFYQSCMYFSVDSKFSSLYLYSSSLSIWCVVLDNAASNMTAKDWRVLCTIFVQILTCVNMKSYNGHYVSISLNMKCSYLWVREVRSLDGRGSMWPPHHRLQGPLQVVLEAADELLLVQGYDTGHAQQQQHQGLSRKHWGH